jgi:hypothetical protein
MSHVGLHVGQCGIQLGEACVRLLDDVCGDHGDMSPGFATFCSAATTFQPRPQCVLVDTEPKAVQVCAHMQFLLMVTIV